MTQGAMVSAPKATTSATEWEPESPFASDVPLSPGVATAIATSPSQAFAPSQLESPFVSEYAGEDGVAGPQAEVFASLVGEFYDQEFEEALEDLVNEATAVAEEQFSSEVGDPAQQRLEVERSLEAYLQPLERAAEAMLDRMASGLAEKNLEQLTEVELEALLEQFAPVEAGLSPTFENALGGVFRKAKKALKKVTKFLPHSLILGKLKGLVRPLLHRVLRFAIDKLPVKLRPIAQQLAKKFLSAPGAGEIETLSEVEEASADSVAIQQELDAQLAGFLVQGEDFERDAALQEALLEQAAPIGDPISELAHSRGQFAQHVVDLQPGEDPKPLVEQFVPAILAAMKLGIKIIGRPRVVKFLADLIAKLISKYVGREQAVSLSRALVDAGLRLVSLEAAEEPKPLAAGYALASTVEDTVSRLVQTAPPAAWESEALLEGYAVEAFQQAASAHFPDQVIREELHEAAKVSGAWVALPDGTARKLYKKYSRIVETTITPQIAAAIKTFGGITLSDFLKDRLGLPTGKPIQGVRVHLYEAIPGTRLSLIALSEKKVSGLGQARREAWSLIHPLTPEASGLLLNEPGLGRALEPQFLARRGKVAVGQRFYYLEIPGARVRMAPRGVKKFGRPTRLSQTNVVLDFTKRELRVFIFYSESDAQKLAEQLRKRLQISALLTALRAKLDIGRGFRIIHEAAPTEQFETKVGFDVRNILKEKLLNWLVDLLKRELEARYDRFVGEFERAAREEADGVTLVIVLQAPTVLERLRPLLKAGSAVLGISGILFQGDYKFEIRPGFAYW